MAGSVSVTLSKVDPSGIDSGKRKLLFTWTADAANGSVPDTAISANQAKVLRGLKAILGVTNPGATAPTANYDITLVDADGVDVFGGSLTNRSDTASEQAKPDMTTLGGSRMVNGTLTFKLANNSVNSALGTCAIYFEK